MTDNEIIKVVNYCANVKDYEDCKKCPIKTICDNHTERLIIAVADLINRQKAENCELQHRIDELQHRIVELKADISWNRVEKENLRCVISDLSVNTETAKAEAIKEFAERLKQVFYNDEFIFTRNIIDNLVKEMVGDNE